MSDVLDEYMKNHEAMLQAAKSKLANAEWQVMNSKLQVDIKESICKILRDKFTEVRNEAGV